MPTTEKPDTADTAKQHLEEAYAREAAEELEKALQECESAIQADPGLAEAHNLQGVILEQLDRTEDAIAAYEEAVRLDPNFAEARQNLQEAQREQQQTRTRKQAWPIALWSALAYGVSFAIADALMERVAMATITLAIRATPAGSDAAPKNVVKVLFLGALLGTSACAIGCFVLGKTSRVHNLKLFVAAGALGFGIMFLVANGLGIALLPSILKRLAQDWLIQNNLGLTAWTIQFALIGASMGLGLGLTQRQPKLTRRLTLAGAVLGGIVTIELIQPPMMISLPTSGFYEQLISIIAFISFQRTLRVLLVVGIEGLLLGLIMARREPAMASSE